MHHSVSMSVLSAFAAAMALAKPTSWTPSIIYVSQKATLRNLISKMFIIVHKVSGWKEHLSWIVS